MDSLSPIIGIDFGTSSSKMAWYNLKTRQAEILRNAEGEYHTPSVVYFGKTQTLVGTPALNMLVDERERDYVINSIKRRMLRTPSIYLGDKAIKAVDVVAAVLSKLKCDAEDLHFRQKINHA